MEKQNTQKIKDHLIDIKDDGTFRLDMKYFKFHRGFMTSNRFNKLFNSPPRKGESQLTQFHMDIAASIQSVTEEIIIKLCRTIRNETGIENLCLSWCCFKLRRKWKIIKEKIFKNIWIQPASGDAGSSIGAALTCWYSNLNNNRKINPKDSMQGAYLGCKFSNKEIINYLKENKSPLGLLKIKNYLNESLLTLMKAKLLVGLMIG